MVMMEVSSNLNRVVKYLLTPVNLEMSRSNSNLIYYFHTDATKRKTFLKKVFPNFKVDSFDNN